MFGPFWGVVHGLMGVVLIPSAMGRPREEAGARRISGAWPIGCGQGPDGPEKAGRAAGGRHNRRLSEEFRTAPRPETLRVHEPKKGRVHGGSCLCFRVRVPPQGGEASDGEKQAFYALNWSQILDPFRKLHHEPPPPPPYPLQSPPPHALRTDLHYQKQGTQRTSHWTPPALHGTQPLWNPAPNPHFSRSPPTPGPRS